MQLCKEERAQYFLSNDVKTSLFLLKVKGSCNIQVYNAEKTLEIHIVHAMVYLLLWDFLLEFFEF